MEGLEAEIIAKMRIDAKVKELEKVIEEGFSCPIEDFFLDASNRIADMILQTSPVDGIYGVLRDLIFEQHILLYEKIQNENHNKQEN